MMAGYTQADSGHSRCLCASIALLVGIICLLLAPCNTLGSDEVTELSIQHVAPILPPAAVPARPGNYACIKVCFPATEIAIPARCGVGDNRVSVIN